MQTIYVINLLLPFIYFLFLKRMKITGKRQQMLLLLLYAISATLIIGTRTVETGIDTRTYFRFYQNIEDYASKTGISALNWFEPIFTSIGLVCAKIGLSFTWFNIIIAGLTMFFFSIAVLNTDTEMDVLICIYLFICFPFFHQMMNQVRQVMAIMIALYAISCLKNKRLKFVFWILVASAIHLSSLVALVLLPIRRVKFDRKCVEIYAVICAVMVFGNKLFMQFVSRFTYGKYLTQSWRYSNFDILAILNLVVRIVLLLIVLYFAKDIVGKKPSMSIYYHMACICTILQVMAVYNNAIGRITTLFFAGYLILIPKIARSSELFKYRYNRFLLYPALIIGFFVYYYVYNFAKDFAVYESVLFS